MPIVYWDVQKVIIEYDLRQIATGYNGVILRAQDTSNLYMHQVSGPGSATPDNIRWHTKIGGGYAVFPGPIESGLHLELTTWYRVRFEVEGPDFKCYVAEKGDAPDPELASWPDNLLASTWENDQFDEGAIGFRQSGSEHVQFDNVIVTTIGHTSAVSPQDNLVITWGQIKSR